MDLALGRSAEQTTDNDGNFAFNNLLPGSFTVRARPKPVTPAKEAADNRIEAVLTWFPSAIESTQAAPVIVRAGADTSGIRIQLRTVPVYRVRGVVLNEAGKPAAKTTVNLHSREAEPGNGATIMMNLGRARMWFPETGMGPAVETTVTDGQGAFEFPSVREGDWLLRAESEWGYIEDTKRDIQAVASHVVSVSKRDAGDIEIRLAANFELPLTVDFEDAPGASGDDRLMVVLLPVDGGPAVLGMRAKQNENLILDRTYPGEYRVIAQTVSSRFLRRFSGLRGAPGVGSAGRNRIGHAAAARRSAEPCRSGSRSNRERAGSYCSAPFRSERHRAGCGMRGRRAVPVRQSPSRSLWDRRIRPYRRLPAQRPRIHHAAAGHREEHPRGRRRKPLDGTPCHPVARLIP